MLRIVRCGVFTYKVASESYSLPERRSPPHRIALQITPLCILANHTTSHHFTRVEQRGLIMRNIYYGAVACCLFLLFLITLQVRDVPHMELTSVVSTRSATSNWEAEADVRNFREAAIAFCASQHKIDAARQPCPPASTCPATRLPCLAQVSTPLSLSRAYLPDSAVGWENPATGAAAMAARPLRSVVLPNCPVGTDAGAALPPAAKQDSLFDLSDSVGVIANVTVVHSWQADVGLRTSTVAFVNVSFSITAFAEHMEYHDAYAWIYSSSVISVGNITATTPPFMTHLRVVNAKTPFFLTVKLTLVDVEDYALHILCRLLVKGRMYLFRVGDPIPIRVRAAHDDAGPSLVSPLPATICVGWTHRPGRWLACAALGAAWIGGCLRDGWVFVPYECRYHVCV